MRLTWPELGHDDSLKSGAQALNQAPKIRHGTLRRGGPPRAIHALPSSRKEGVDARPSPSMTWWSEDGPGQRYPRLLTAIE
jgi:hypothetical protein